MYNLPGSIYLVTIFVFFQGFLVLLVIFLFIDKFFSLRKQRLEAATLKNEAHARALQELESAKTSAAQIVQDATKKAAYIINNTELLSADAKNHLSESIKLLVSKEGTSLEEMVSLFGRELREDFNKDKITTLADFNAVYDTLKGEVKTQIAEYKEVLTKNSLDTEQYLKSQTESYITDTRTKLADYEQKQLQKIEDRVFTILLQVSNEFFGQTTTVSDHENLVLKLFSDATLKEKLGV